MSKSKIHILSWSKIESEIDDIESLVSNPNFKETLSDFTKEVYLDEAINDGVEPLISQNIDLNQIEYRFWQNMFERLVYVKKSLNLSGSTVKFIDRITYLDAIIDEKLSEFGSYLDFPILKFSNNYNTPNNILILYSILSKDIIRTTEKNFLKHFDYGHFTSITIRERKESKLGFIFQYLIHKGIFKQYSETGFKQILTNRFKKENHEPLSENNIKQIIKRSKNCRDSLSFQELIRNSTLIESIDSDFETI